MIIAINASTQGVVANCSGMIDADQTPFAKIIGKTANEDLVVFAHSKSKKKAKLIEFDNDLHYKSEINLAFEDEIIQYCTVIDGKIIVFSAKVIENTNFLLARNYEDYEFSEPKVICKTQFINSVFDFAKSQNDKYLGIIAETPYLKGKNEEIELWIFDSLLNEQLNYSLALTEKNTRVKINVPVMSNSGVLFLIKRHTIAQDNNYFVYSINPHTKKHQRKSLTLMGKRIADLKYQLDTENNLYLTGFFSAQNYHVFQGFFYYKLDQNSRALDFKQNNFDAGFLIQAEGKKNAKKHGGLLNYKMGVMQLFQGKTYFTASHTLREKYTIDQEQHMSYTTNKLAVIGLDKGGLIEMSETFEVNQKSADDQGFWNKHHFFSDTNKLSILHNETSNGLVSLKINQFIDTNNVFIPMQDFKIYNNPHDSSGLDLTTLMGTNSNHYLLNWNANRNKFAIWNLFYAKNE
jgi:hypothetical protein